MTNYFSTVLHDGRNGKHSSSWPCVRPATYQLHARHTRGRTAHVPCTVNRAAKLREKGGMSLHRKRDCRRPQKGRYLWCCALLLGLGRGAGFQISSSFSALGRREQGLAHCQRGAQRARRTWKIVSNCAGESGVGDLEGDEDGTDLMSRLMEEVNQRESLRRREGVRLLKRPSALLPPHAVLEHVLGSLRTPDFPTDGVGLQQAFLFSALDQEVSRGPVDYRRDWSDEDEGHPRYLDKDDCATVIKNVLGFLVGMSDFSLTGAPVFSEDDHRVTFSMRIVPDALTSAMSWVDVDFRLGRVRDGSYKDCWLVERAIVRAWGGTPDAKV